MFQFFRRRDTLVRWFLGGLLLLICVMLVVTLIPGLSTPTSDDASVVAKVAGEEVTTFELQRYVQQIARSNRLPASLLPVYTPQILNQIIMEKAGQYEARRLGLLVSEEEMAEQLRLNPALFPGGEFVGNDRYQNYVEQSFGLSIPQFEEMFRRSLLVDKLRRVVTDGVAVSDAEADAEYRRRNDKIKVEYVALKPVDFMAQVEVSEADLKAFFDRNRSHYTSPERRRVKFLNQDLQKARENVEVSEQEIRRFYEQNKERFRVEDRVQVSHILLKTVDKTPPQVQELEKKARELLEKARAGEDFAALAKQNSEDTATQAKGGDLGWVRRGQTVPEFEKAAFSLDPGKISDVIKTVYGFHILKVGARERAHQQTLEEARAQALPQLKQQKGERLAQEMSDRLESALRRNPRNLEALAQELKLPLLEAPGHLRGGALPELGPSTVFDDVAFSLRAGEVSGVVNAGQGLAVLRVEKITPEHPAELLDVRPQVEQGCRREKATEMSKKRAGDLAERARSLGELAKAAAEFNLTVKTSEPFSREGSIAGVGPVASFSGAAFRMKVGEIGGPVTVDGADLLYRVVEQIFVTPEDVAKNRDTVRPQMLDQKRNSVFQLFLEELRRRLEKEGKLKTNEAALKRFTGGL